jgi:hypothetical protein
VGKSFPCPVCGTAMQIRVARTGKPYCHCDPCGIQLFFRRSDGIRRLRQILASETLISGSGSRATSAVILYNRLQQLKSAKQELEDKQGVFFRDGDLDNAIAAVQIDIEVVQSELEKISEQNRKGRLS